MFAYYPDTLRQLDIGAWIATNSAPNDSSAPKTINQRLRSTPFWDSEAEGWAEILPLVR